MIDLTTIQILIATHGLWVVAPIAVLEGPIVSVISAWLAQRGLFDLTQLILVLVLADLAGDALLYALGRWGLHLLPATWLRRVGLREGRLRLMSRKFGHQGGRILTLGKLTHVAGAAVLVAAGLARMPFAAFMLYNTLATIPKTLAFVALGYLIGHTYRLIYLWLSNASLAVLAAMAIALAAWMLRLRACK
ncbi:DedA family protein [Donghicola eburneus]|uniref:DedA family protein n=1 Tax=Donghicola eburneus TaxID=393278 RepID=UPI0008EB940D|nr:VTT domain-containing protein [Donghicola eburneus]SFQ56385.1 membrane protein DedA, SNARE-associated domain [Donghicola eburneus]